MGSNFEYYRGLDTGGRLMLAANNVYTLAKENRETLKRVDVHVSITSSGRIVVNVVGDARYDVRKNVVDKLALHAKAGEPDLIWDGTYAANTGDWYIGTRGPDEPCPRCGCTKRHGGAR